MIVQTAAAENQPHFVITMEQHTALSALFATHFGNAEFEAVHPRELMLHVIGHHDAGWRDLDAQALRDPATGLPYNLVQTPFEYIVKTSKASPDFNSQCHPYCELISSMHSWGLYNGRYGMSDKVLLDSLAAENRSVADGMLNEEHARQERLKSALAANPESAAWIDEAHLFQNYKQLQFFDTLALYFNCVHEDDRQAACYAHIPMSATVDATIEITPLGNSTYAFDPYPFDTDNLELEFAGRYLAPASEGSDVRAALSEAPVTHQRIRLCRMPKREH